MGYDGVFFKEVNYLVVRYELVKEVCIFQVIFSTLLIVHQEDINHNHNMD